MKINTQTTLIVVAKGEPTKSSDGKTTYYKFACLQNGQATNLSVTEEVYHEFPSGMVEAKFNTVYDDKYGSLKIDSVAEIISVNGAKPDAKAASSAASAKQ